MSPKPSCLYLLSSPPNLTHAQNLLIMQLHPLPLLAAILIATPTLPLLAEEPVLITLKTLTAQMKFDQSELRVSPGARVKLTFENPDDMPHNVVFCLPGTDVEQLVLRMLEKPDEALKRNFLPQDPKVWLTSRLLNPSEKQEIEFTAPEKPGKHPYVCSFPGHAASMKGILHVLPQGSKIQDLQFALYLGSWKQLPDFSKLTPHRQGKVDDNLIQLHFDDYQNHYGLVFTGKLKTHGGFHTFLIASDDGARLFVDDQIVLTDDGLHPSRIKEGRIHVRPGEHTVRLEYFQAEGPAELFLGWRGESFDTTPLSKWTPENWNAPVAQKKDEFIGLPLEPREAPIVYRNFIAGAGNRSIGVGFPNGLHFAWSAKTMNLALAWKGAFIDAARHWKDRGAGHQPPAGFDIVSPTDLVPPMAVLASADTPWPTFTPDENPEGYVWKGYELDAKGIPTFRYSWKGAEVEDRIEPKGHFKEPGAQLVRTLRISGKVPDQTFVLLARSATVHPVEKGFLVKADKLQLPSGNFDNHFQIQAEGATPRGKLLVVPARPEIQIHYSWPSTHSAHAPHAAH
jgi:plastocyanin